MRITVAIDSFKGSLSSMEAGTAVKEGILKVFEDAEISVLPLADGGEGTTEALSDALNGKKFTIEVTGPLFEKVTAEYAIISGDTAVIEMSQCAGITLVPLAERNPLETTTYGVGEMIKDAISRGSRKFIIGIGGSATNDGGLGMLSALGFDFLDENGEKVYPSGKGLEKVRTISTVNVLPQLSECTFKIACDVTNPLCGENGSSRVYGPQKGATEKIIEDMDKWLKNYSDIASTISPKADRNYPGAGAAGGLGFAFLSFTNSSLQSGIEIIIKETQLEKYITDSDIVITGEGRLDGQTVMGKAPIGVASIAKKYGKKVIAFSGAVTDDATICNAHGIDAFFPVLREVTTLETALDKKYAYKNLRETACQVFRLIKLFK